MVTQGCLTMIKLTLARCVHNECAKLKLTLARCVHNECAMHTQTILHVECSTDSTDHILTTSVPLTQTSLPSITCNQPQAISKKTPG